MVGQRKSAISGQRTIELVTLDERCPYLPGHSASLKGFFAARIDPALFSQLVQRGFRRSGRFFYETHCDGCRACEPIRVPTATFAPSRSQRRCVVRNRDLVVAAGEPELTEEKSSLYRDYVSVKHGEEARSDMGALWEFLYNPVVPSMEFCYRSPAGRLLAVSICDVFDDALNSVYCYYDTSQSKRGLGTYSALFEIGYAQQLSLAYYYLGYLVRQCPAMSYKSSFRPHEVLGADARWRTTDDS